MSSLPNPGNTGVFTTIPSIGFIPPDISHTLVQEYSTLAKKHVHVSFALIGALALVLAVAGIGGYFGLKSYDRLVAQAEAQQAAYDKQSKAFTDLLAQDAVLRAQSEAQQAALLAKIASRDKAPVPPGIAPGLKPDATAEEAKTALNLAYTGQQGWDGVQAQPDGKVAATVNSTQILTRNKLALDRLQLDFQDLKTINNLLNSDNSRQVNEIAACKADLGTANKTIQDWQKAAKKSKFRKFLDGAEKMALVVTGIVIGRKI